MKLKKRNLSEYQMIIIIVLLFIFIWIVVFQIIFLQANALIEKMYILNSKDLLANIEKIYNNDFIAIPLLREIIEYDNDNYKDRILLYKKDSKVFESINYFQRTFIFNHPHKKNKKILFIYTEISPLLYSLTFFTSILGIAMFFAFIVFFVNFHNNEQRKYNKILQYMKDNKWNEISKFQNLNNGINNILTYIVTIISEHQNIVDEMKMKMIKLEDDNYNLKNKDILKTGILENISHELKSPLTKVKGYLDFIYNEKMGKLSDTQKNGLLIAKKNVDLLLKQIEQILRYAKDEAFILEKQIFSLRNLLREIANSYKFQIEEKNIDFIVNIKNLKTPVNGDRSSIYEVIDNLLSNALKFTGKNGKIKLIAYEREMENKLYAVIKIEDTGIGIPVDKIDKLFDRFYQIEYNTNRKYSGMGLGLTIAKNIIEMHNGKITVNSMIDKGTIFTIYFPIEEKGGRI